MSDTEGHEAVSEESITSISIAREGGANYHYIDIAAAASNPRGDVELSGFSLRNRFDHQLFRSSPIPDGEALLADRIVGGPTIVEVAVLRMRVEVALEVVEMLSRHLVRRHGVEPDQIRKLVEGIGSDEREA